MTPAGRVGIHRATRGGPRNRDRRRVARGGEAHRDEILDLVGLQRGVGGSDDELCDSRVWFADADVTTRDEAKNDSEQGETMGQRPSDQHQRLPACVCGNLSAGARA